METEVFHLSEKNPDVRITAYLSGTYERIPHNEKRPAILIFPGGGYAYCSSREAEPIAHEFIAHGYNAFVFDYSVNGAAVYPTQLIEASLAMKFLRDNAEKLRIDPERIFTIGFSAGGHLAAMLGTMWHKNFIYDAIDMPYGYNKPTGMILCYPVITSGKYAHRGSFDTLLGDGKNDKKLLREVSLEYAVTKKTVPTFIWHTRADKTVPVINSILFAEALSKKNIPYELHIYPDGWHGMTLCREFLDAENEYIGDWVRCAEHWMKNTK